MSGNIVDELPDDECVCAAHSVSPATSEVITGAAPADSGDRFTVDDIVTIEDKNSEEYKTTVEVIDQIRQLIHATFMTVNEISIMLAFVHWYSDLFDRKALQFLAQNFDQYRELMQAVASITTRIADTLCGEDVHIYVPRQHNLELCYSVRWPAELRAVGEAKTFCRGSHGAVYTFMHRYVEKGWMKPEGVFDPSTAQEVPDHIREHMKALNVAAAALQKAYERLRKAKKYSDLNKLYIYLFYDVPPLTCQNLPDFVWRLHFIMTVFMSPMHADKRYYGARETLMVENMEEFDKNVEDNRIAEGIMKLSKK